MADDFEVLNSDDDEAQETTLENTESKAEETNKRTREEEPTVVKVRRGSDQPRADQDGERKKRKGWASAVSQEDTTSITSDLLKSDNTNGDTEEQQDSVREQNGSDAEEPTPLVATRCLHVSNFVRPLTKMQVDGLLAEAGRLAEDPDTAFWMDRKKSHMYCTYETVEMAVAAYGIMNGLKFPPINPKTLKVEYVLEEEIRDLIAKAAAAEGGMPDRRQRVSANERPLPPPRRASDRETRVRERSEIKEEPETVKEVVKEEANIKREEKEKKTEEREEKSLDDLFRKTTTEPVIYWLPLTDEQIKATEESKRKNR